MQLVKISSFITIPELMESLNVSKSTITRDLIELENQGLIKRERGGAMAVEIEDSLSTYNEVPILNKEHLKEEEKRKICSLAAKNIKDGDCIYIDSGTTPSYLLPYIVDKQIQIVTTSTYLIRKIPATFKGEIFLLGGNFIVKHDMSIGPMAINMIQQFNFDKAFMSTNGINLKNQEVYIFDFQVGSLKAEILKRSRQNYLLIDASKIYQKAICTWAKLDQFNTIYIDDFLDTMDPPDNFVICQ